MKHNLPTKLVTTWMLVGLLLHCIAPGLWAAPVKDGQPTSIEEIYLTVDYRDLSLEEVFRQLSEETEFNFHYNVKDISEKAIDVRMQNASFADILRYISRKSGLYFERIKETIHVLPIGMRKDRVIEDLSQLDQGRKVGGTVISADDSGGLPGVNVIIKGTTLGTVTDANGHYEIEVGSSEAILVFSFVGFTSQEVAVGDRTTIDITLSSDVSTLEDVVVIGYGIIKKSDLTGSLSSVKGEDIDAFPTSSPLLALSGRAAGVQIIQNTGAPGASVSVRIRGTNSIRGDNEPLYVIDGFPISGSNPSILNNADIQSIEVLKDASATAIYGSRGANGVVLITTKKGKAGSTTVDYESMFSVQQLRKKLDLMNAKEFALFYNEVAANGGLSQRFTPSEIDNFGNGVDWQDFVFQKALMQNHNLTVSGGSERTQFLTSLSILNQDGIIRNSGHDRFTLRTSVNHDISKKLNINTNVVLTRANQANQNSSGGGRGISLIAGALNSFPTVTPYNDDGSIRNLRTIYPWAIEIANPAYYFDETNNRIQSNDVLANLAASYRPVEGLSIRLSGGVEYSDDKSDYYQSSKFITATSSASVGASKMTSLLGEVTANYTKDFGKHHLTALVGGTYQDFLHTSMNLSGAGFLSDVFETYDIGAATSIGIPSTGYSLSVLLSGLARINYSYNDKILATVSFRGDGSSKYSTGNKWGYFPSGALAWRISDEAFLKNSNKISNLKLRIGWGTTGSQAISAYSTLSRLTSSKTAMGDGLYTTFGPGGTLPGDLRWESTTQVNVGMDVGFIEDRFRFSVDYYSKMTNDLLNPVPLPSSTGFVNTIANVGSIRNKGVEVQLGADVTTGVVKWSIDGNISSNKSEVIKLSQGSDILGSNYNVTIFSDHINILREGEVFGAFYGYQTDGYTDAGLLNYKDLSGDGSITVDDKVVIGDPNPKFYYGLQNSISYKNLDLSIFLQGVSGNDIFNLSSVNNTLDVFFGGNMPREVYIDHWTPENVDAKYPLPSTQNTVRVSDRFIEDGSYLRLRNIQLSYNLPIDASKSNVLKKLQLSLGGQNLLTFTKYSWWDPEVNSLGGSNSVNQGIDYHTYPNYKSIIVGIKAGF